MAYWPSAKRYSIATFLPPTNPVSLKLRFHAATRWLVCPCESALRNASYPPWAAECACGGIVVARRKLMRQLGAPLTRQRSSRRARRHAGRAELAARNNSSVGSRCFRAAQLQPWRGSTAKFAALAQCQAGQIRSLSFRSRLHNISEEPVCRLSELSTPQRPMPQQ